MALSTDWFPEHRNGVICPLAQAKLYPYPAPSVDFWMRDGVPELRPDGIGADELSGREAVISVGSNRTPLQLRRKFGKAAELPVTACILKDCDIAYAATLSFYCAAPATAFPCPGTSVALNVAWLDDQQLAHMHDTEALGVAYDYVRLDCGLVDHGRRSGRVFNQAVYGYQSRAGLLGFDGYAVALKAISATGRTAAAMTETEVLRRIKSIAGDERSLDDWLTAMRGDRSFRLEVMDKLMEYALPSPPSKTMPWQVMDVTAAHPDHYL
jgi:hypothetical protein